MASSLPSCISNTFCSHRQASCVLLVTVVPFFLPFFILFVPFFILFLAPLSSLLFCLLLLYKVQVSISSRRSCIRRKGASGRGTGFIEAPLVDKDGGSLQVLPESAEELDGANTQRMAVSDLGDVEDSCGASSSASNFTGEEPHNVEELDARGELEQRRAEGISTNREEVLSDLHRGHAEHEGFLGDVVPPGTESTIEHTRKEQGFPMEGMPLDLEEKETEEHAKHEGLRVDVVPPGTESAIDHSKKEEGFAMEGMPLDLEEKETEEHAEHEGLHVDVAPPGTESAIEHTKKEQGFPMEGMPLDLEEKETEEHAEHEGLHVDIAPPGTESSIEHTQKEEGFPMEGMPLDLEEKETEEHAEHEGLHVDVAPPCTESAIEHTKKEQGFPMEGMPLDQEEKRTEMEEETTIDTSFQDKILTPLRLTQDYGSFQATSEEGPIGFHHPSSRIPVEELRGDSRKDLPAVELGAHESVAEFKEVPWKDVGDEIFEIPAPHAHVDTQEYGRQDPGLPSQEQSSSITSDFGLGKPENHNLPFLMEKGAQEGEASSSATDGFECERAEAFTKELQDDAPPLKRILESDLQESSEWDQQPFEASSAASSTQGPFEHFKNQDKVQQDERQILADIYAIKKIVGYQGEAHTSIVEQIMALYIFLGMEPYKWDVEVDDLERARAEIEVLKVVVGVK